MVSEHATVPLTQGQFLIWLGQQLQPTAPLYNEAMVYTLRGALDLAALRAAWQALLDSSDALRAVVVADGDTPRQWLRPPFPAELPLVDLSGAADPAAAADDWIRQRAAVPLQTTEQLFDGALLRLDDVTHRWYVNLHHLVTDAWTAALVFRRTAAFYAAARQGEAPDRPVFPPTLPTSPTKTPGATATNSPPDAASGRSAWPPRCRRCLSTTSRRRRKAPGA